MNTTNYVIDINVPFENGEKYLVGYKSSDNDISNMDGPDFAGAKLCINKDELISEIKDVINNFVLEPLDDPNWQDSILITQVLNTEISVSAYNEVEVKKLDQAVKVVDKLVKLLNNSLMPPSDISVDITPEVTEFIKEWDKIRKTLVK